MKTYLDDFSTICSNCCICSVSMEYKYRELSHSYMKQQRHLLNTYGVQTVSLKTIRFFTRQVSCNKGFKKLFL